MILYRWCRHNIRLYNAVWLTQFISTTNYMHASPTTEQHHLRDGVNLLRADAYMCSYEVQSPRMKHTFSLFCCSARYSSHFLSLLKFPLLPPPTCVHTPISTATPHGSINTGCELFSDELLINNKQWGSGETRLGQLGEKEEWRQAVRGWRSAADRISSLSPPVRHNYLSSALHITSNSSPCLRLWQPSTFYCLCSGNIHNSIHNPPITSQARIGIIFYNMSMEENVFLWFAGIW